MSWEHHIEDIVKFPIETKGRLSIITQDLMDTVFGAEFTKWAKKVILLLVIA